MRKFLLVLSTAVVSVTCYQQTSYAEGAAEQQQAQLTVATPQNAIQLFDKTLDKMTASITTAVSVLSDAVKKIAPEMWRILIRQQYAIVASALIPLLLVALTLLFVRKKLLSWKGKHDLSNHNYDCACCIPFAIFWVITCILVVTTCVALSDNIPRIINPEYYAVKELISFVK